MTFCSKKRAWVTGQKGPIPERPMPKSPLYKRVPERPTFGYRKAHSLFRVCTTYLNVVKPL